MSWLAKLLTCQSCECKSSTPEATRVQEEEKIIVIFFSHDFDFWHILQIPHITVLKLDVIFTISSSRPLHFETHTALRLQSGSGRCCLPLASGERSWMYRVWCVCRILKGHQQILHSKQRFMYFYSWTKLKVIKICRHYWSGFWE